MINTKKYLSWVWLVAMISLYSCSSQLSEKTAFIIPATTPATALSIGWYVHIDSLTGLTGAFTPRVMKDDSMGVILLYLVQGEEHLVDKNSLGQTRSAHVVIPVVSPTDMEVGDQSAIEATMVCPLNIISKSEELETRYREFDFETIKGDIKLDIRKTGNAYYAQASVFTGRGKFGIRARFSEPGEQKEVSSAMINPDSGPLRFFYGKERFTRLDKGSGNLINKSDKVFNLLHLSNTPDFLNLDTDLSWEFDFYKGQ